MVRIYLTQTVKRKDSIVPSVNSEAFGDGCRFDLFSFFLRLRDKCFPLGILTDANLDPDVLEVKISIKFVRK